MIPWCQLEPLNLPEPAEPTVTLLTVVTEFEILEKIVMMETCKLEMVVLPTVLLNVVTAVLILVNNAILELQ